jgi:hypothetical protein
MCCSSTQRWRAFAGRHVFVLASCSGLQGHKRTYLTILESADHALFKMVRYVSLCPPATFEAEVRCQDKNVSSREDALLWACLNHWYRLIQLIQTDTDWYRLMHTFTHWYTPISTYISMTAERLSNLMTGPRRMPWPRRLYQWGSNCSSLINCSKLLIFNPTDTSFMSMSLSQ